MFQCASKLGHRLIMMIFKVFAVKPMQAHSFNVNIEITDSLLLSLTSTDARDLFAFLPFSDIFFIKRKQTY